MNKAKEISALWSEIRLQIGKMINLCHQIESHTEDASEAYQRGYEKGFVAGHLKAEKSGQSFYEDGYKRGLADAWDAARKIYGSATKHGLPTEVITKIFRDDGKENFNYWDIVEDFSPVEAIEKIRQYEQEKEEIQLWDEVINGRNFKGTVTGIEDNGILTIFCQDGTWIKSHVKSWKKTGRHFHEIAEVLKKMKEES